jgi:CRP/FNR family transcriptional regulator
MVRLSPIKACNDCPIRYRAVCAECDADELAMLEQIKTYQSYDAGAHLASAGEDLEHFSSIVSGCATMSRTLEDGRRQTVGLLLPSDFIGRPGRVQSAFDVQAIGPVTLCRFERHSFERLIRNTPHIASRLMTMSLDELDAARDWAVVLGRMTAREKLAAFLVSLTRRFTQGAGGPRPSGGGVTLQLPLTREELSDHLGLTIETTSRQMTALRKDGLIDLRPAREVFIPDFGALCIEAGEDGDGGPIV